MRETRDAGERLLVPLTLLLALGGCAQFPALVDGADADGDADTDTDADADVPPIDCGSGLEAIDLNRAGREVAGGFTYSGVLTAGPGVTSGTCATEEGNEVVLAFTPAQSGDLIVDTFGTDPNLDTVLYVRTQCEADGTELSNGCNDDWVFNFSCYLSALKVLNSAVAGVPVYIFVDGWNEDAAGEFTVTAIARQVQALGADCDPAGVLNRCVPGALCRQGTCEAGGFPTLTVLSALDASGEEIPFLRLVVEGTDEDQDVTDIDITVSFVAGGEPWSWPAPLYQVDWTGTSYFAFVDIDLSGMSEILDVEAAVIDEVGNASDPLRSTPQPVPMRELGESCDPDWLVNWCNEGLWCDEETELCASNDPPVLTSIEVRYLTDGFRVSLVGSDPDGDVMGAEYTFINSSSADVPDPDWGTDIWRDMAWSVRGSTAFTAGFEVFMVPPGATGMRVELFDVAGNESNSVLGQGEAIEQRVAGESCDPTAATNICDGTCVDEQCIDQAICRQQVCGSALPALTPGTPMLVRFASFDAGCFMVRCNEWTGPEAVFSLEVPGRSRVVVNAQNSSGYNAPNLYLALLTSCENVDSDLACADYYLFRPACTWEYTPTTVFDQLVLDDVAPGTYYVVADTWGPQGDFELLAELTPL